MTTRSPAGHAWLFIFNGMPGAHGRRMTTFDDTLTTLMTTLVTTLVTTLMTTGRGGFDDVGGRP
jgi:hypothetical protein